MRRSLMEKACSMDGAKCRMHTCALDNLDQSSRVAGRSRGSKHQARRQSEAARNIPRRQTSKLSGVILQYDFFRP